MSQTSPSGCSISPLTMEHGPVVSQDVRFVQNRVQGIRSTTASLTTLLFLGVIELLGLNLCVSSDTRMLRNRPADSGESPLVQTR